MTKGTGRPDRTGFADANDDASPVNGGDGKAIAAIACRECAREVPASEAVIPEATDYVVYLCGVDCYQRWRSGAK
jgi:hypothetical protein